PALVAVDADGGIPYESFLGPQLLSDVKDLRLAGNGNHYTEKPCLAVSSDDQYVYFAGLSTGASDWDSKKAKPIPCVFRVDASKRTPTEAFVGKLGQSGASAAGESGASATGGRQTLLTAPRGLAVAKGLLYVADPGADRVVAFKEADRSYV